MSIVSSYISSRAPFLSINAQAVSIMDSIFAIAIGLGIRVVIDFVSHQDNRLTGTLVGLWEGVVMQHFMRKMPRSSDPYVAYGVRLFVDFLFTESLWRLVLTLVWTGMGMILADIAPGIWVDVGLRRFWRHFRRDIYMMTQSVPSISLFARPRTVRFSPSRTTSGVSSAPPSVITNTTQAPTSRPAPSAPTLRKRLVPGAFPGDASETETELGSILGLRSPRSDASTSPGTAHHRFSALPRRRVTVETGSELSYDLDEGNISSSDSSYTRTPLLNEEDMPIIEDEEDVDTEREVVLDKGKEKDESTPKQKSIVLPPTPSDSAFALHHHPNEPQEVLPPAAEVPNIPDDDDWENISRREALHTPPPGSAKDTPPTPPAKDVQITAKSPSPLPQQVSPPTTSTNQEQLVDTGSTPPAAKTVVNDLLSLDTPPPQQTQINPWATAPAPSAPTTTTTTQSADNMEYSFLGRPPSYSQFQLNVDQLLDSVDTAQTPPADDRPAAAPTATTEPPAGGDTGNTEGTIADSGIAANTGTTITDQQPSEERLLANEAQPSATAPETAVQQASKELDQKPPAAAETGADDESDFAYDESLPKNSKERLLRALELRKQAIELEKGISELRRQLESAQADDEKALVASKQLLVDNSVKEIAKVNKKIDRLYMVARDLLEDELSADLDVSDLTGDDVLVTVEEVLTRLVLKNQPVLTVSVAPKAPGRAQRAALAGRMEDLSIEFVKGQKVVITLPTTPTLIDS